MKKIYNAPEADLLCFRPVEELATGDGIDFDNIFDVTDPDAYGKKSDKAASYTLGDINVSTKK